MHRCVACGRRFGLDLGRGGIPLEQLDGDFSDQEFAQLQDC